MHWYKLLIIIMQKSDPVVIYLFIYLSIYLFIIYLLFVVYFYLYIFFVNYLLLFLTCSIFVIINNIIIVLPSSLFHHGNHHAPSPSSLARNPIFPEPTILAVTQTNYSKSGDGLDSGVLGIKAC